MHTSASLDKPKHNGQIHIPFPYVVQKKQTQLDAKKKGRAARGKGAKSMDKENKAEDLNCSAFETEEESDCDDSDLRFRGSMEECAGYSLFAADGRVLNVVCPHDRAEVVRPVSKVGLLCYRQTHGTPARPHPNT
jgi:hypothetical protein